MEKFIKLADIRKLNKQVSLGEISSSRMIEIINEKAIEYAKMYVENFKIEQAELTTETTDDAKHVLPAVRSFNYWTKNELEALPAREWNEYIGEFDSLIILPTKHLHDSGFWCMDFVAVKGNEPFCRLSGCSDVIHIDGIGGYGEWKQNVPTVIPPKGWGIDCLKKSKLLRLFSDGKLKAGRALSSFDLYAVK